MDRFRHARGLNPHHQAIISQSSPGRLPVRATTLIFLWITLIQRIISRSPRANTEPLRSGGLNVVLETWLGAFAPARTPPDMVRALNAAIGVALRSPEMMENLARSGNEPKFQSPEEFAATVRADLERWGPVVKASGFVAEE